MSIKQIFIISVLSTCPTFEGGDGIGDHEKWMGKLKDEKCIEACKELQKNDSNVNGVTVRQGNKKGCYCERNMAKVISGQTGYKTCFLVPN